MIGAGSVLDGTIKLQDGTEIGESVQIHGPSGAFPDELATEIDRDCEVLDRATIRSGARLGERTHLGSAAEAGHAVVTGAGTEILDELRVGDFSVINGSMIGEGATVGHGVQTGYGADLGERTVIEDIVVIEPHARVDADGYIPHGVVVTEASR